MKKYNFLTRCAALSLAGLLMSTFTAFADASVRPDEEKYLNIATIESRPLSNDRFLYTALKEIDYHAAFASVYLQTGYDMANDGDKDGVIASTPDIELTYTNLRKIPVPLEQTYLYAFVREDSGLQINSWGDLSGHKVGINSQRPFTSSQIPDSATVFERETATLVMEGLAAGEYDVAVLSHRAHETLNMLDGIIQSGQLGQLADYLYLHKSRENLIPEITRVLNGMFADGRAEDILNDIRVPETGRKQTVLHIISSNMQVTREEQLIAKLREPFEDDMSIDWYTVELSSRRFFRDENRLGYFANLLRQDCVSRDLAAIIVSGDDAMDFLKSYYYLFFRNVPVLFYGVNEDYDTVIQGYEPYFTGITETISAYETVSMGLKLFPDTKNLYVINDEATEGRYYRAAVRHQLEPLSSSINIEYNDDTDCDSLIEHIKELPQDTLVFVGSYFCDSNWQYYPLKEMKRLLDRNCGVPILALQSTNVEYNSIGGKCLDYEKFGETIAGMLVDVLDGKNVADIPAITDTESWSRWVFDKIMLDKMNIGEKSLPGGSQILNITPSIWESDPRFAFTLVALLVLGIAAAAGISYLSIRYRRQRELIIRDEKIREVKERLERIINTAPLAFMITIDGIAVEANEYIKRYIGIETGCKVPAFYTDPNQRGGLVEKALSQELVEDQIVKFNMSYGGNHRFLSNVTVIDYDGRQGFILWAMDIEERERQKDQLDTMRHSLQTILDLLPVPIRILDIHENAVAYLNKAAADLFKFPSPEAMYGKPAYDFMRTDGSDSIGETCRLNGEEPGSAEIVCFNADGEAFDCLVTACLIDYQGKKASLGIMKDLTAEKEYQRMLRDTAEKEREANQLKSRFLVNMSHEIRTPMNAVIGLTEIELRKNPPKESKEIYKKINISAKNLLEIINDILDLSKIEADKIELFDDEFELEDVLNSALLVAAPRLDGKNVEFMLNASLDLPRYVIGDKTRLWQVLKNFLDNSAKYTENGKIVLTAFINSNRSDEQTMTITFIIEDTGIGIDEEQMKKLFMPYEQVRNDAQKKYTGTGLGMAISKQLCEIMGGDLQVQSSMGVGTTIIMNIPFKRSANSETEMQAVKSPVLAGLNVLAVDDDEISLDIMAKLLEGNNVNCMLVKSGMEAMEVILEHRDRGESFDIILLDYMMDGLNGLETAKQIHLALSKAPKLLMVTAYQKLLLKHQLEKNGIDDIIEKPFIPSQFINKLCMTLGYECDSVDENEEVFARYTDAKVLLCEDYRLNQEVAVGMFAQFGIVADIAENGKQAVEILNSGKQFDLIFMDLQMPVMDGYEATRIIRADSRFDDIPVVSLTADAMKEVVDKCLEIGMNDHVAKPIEFDSLNRVFLKWLPESKRVTGETGSNLSFDRSNPALARFGGDKAFYLRALLDFADMLPEEWPDFENAVENAEETGRLVHKIKGAAGNLSEDEIYQCATGFESSLRGEAPEADLYNRLIDACDTARTRILKQAENPEDTLLETGTIEEFTELLNRLEDALQSYNPRASSKVLDSLKEKSWPSTDEQKLQELYGIVRKYEFDAALDALNSIRMEQK